MVSVMLLDRSAPITAALLLFVGLLCASCSDDAASEALPTAGPGGHGQAGLWPHLDCDSLVPEICAYPFPNNVYTEPDESTPTGRRVSLYAQTIPQKQGGEPVDPSPWSQSDGFSAGVAVLAYLPGATLEGLPHPDDIDRSLEDDCPTVLLDAETGERVPHFAELDMANAADEMRALLLRPVERLNDATRYIAALRGVQSADGAIAPSPSFRALRDGTAAGADWSVDDRRELYADIFARLSDAGVGRADLQLAWDFHTASLDNNTGWLLHMRDEALELSGEDGPPYRIDVVDESFRPEHIAYRIEGVMTVPLYLDEPTPGAALLFGDDGLPEPNPDEPTYEVPFELIIPHSALTEPARLLQHGHGLLGSRTQVEASHFASWMNEHNYAMFAVDLEGMCGDGDDTHILDSVSTGRYHLLARMYDRMHQGQLNYLLAMRMMSRGMASDPTYGPLLDGEHRYYQGISQGGIAGGVYLALSTDVERGMLGVPGQSYNLLLNRSVDFRPFFLFLAMSAPKGADQQILLSLAQMLWDRVEPSGYTQHVTGDPLPGTPTKQVLIRSAIGDHQVTTLGAHVMARAMNAQHLDNGLRSVWGLDHVAAPTADAVYVEYDFGLPPEPSCNVPMDVCDDPHGHVARLDEARQQLDHFFRHGEVLDFCSGPCSFPELSGCEGDEDPEAPCQP